MAGKRKSLISDATGRLTGLLRVDVEGALATRVEDWSVVEINAHWVRSVWSGANPPLEVDLRRHLEPV